MCRLDFAPSSFRAAHSSRWRPYNGVKFREAPAPLITKFYTTAPQLGQFSASRLARPSEVTVCLLWTCRLACRRRTAALRDFVADKGTHAEKSQPKCGRLPPAAPGLIGVGRVIGRAFPRPLLSIGS